MPFYITLSWFRTEESRHELLNKSYTTLFKECVKNLKQKEPQEIQEEIINKLLDIYQNFINYKGNNQNWLLQNIFCFHSNTSKLEKKLETLVCSLIYRFLNNKFIILKSDGEFILSENPILIEIGEYAYKKAHLFALSSNTALYMWIDFPLEKSNLFDQNIINSLTEKYYFKNKKKKDVNGNYLENHKFIKNGNYISLDLNCDYEFYIKNISLKDKIEIPLLKISENVLYKINYSYLIKNKGRNIIKNYSTINQTIKYVMKNYELSEKSISFLNSLIKKEWEK